MNAVLSYFDSYSDTSTTMRTVILTIHRTNRPHLPEFPIFTIMGETAPATTTAADGAAQTGGSYEIGTKGSNGTNTQAAGATVVPALFDGGVVVRGMTACFVTDF